MSKVIYRYRVTVGNIDSVVAPSGTVVLVAADRGGKSDVVEVWIEHEAHDGAAMPGPGSITLNVYGTGHPIPDEENVHVGSCISGPFVWHVYATYDDGGKQ